MSLLVARSTHAPWTRLVGPAQETAVARVPRAVSRVGTSSIACGVLLLAALWRVVTW
jgi:hypothetical protein